MIKMNILELLSWCVVFGILAYCIFSGDPSGFDILKERLEATYG